MVRSLVKTNGGGTTKSSGVVASLRQPFFFFFFFWIFFKENIVFGNLIAHSYACESLLKAN